MSSDSEIDRPEHAKHRHGSTTNRYATVGTIILVAASLLVTFFPTPGMLFYPVLKDFYLWLAGGQLLMMGTIVWLSGVPATRGGKLIFLVLNLLLLTIALLRLLNLLEYAYIRLFEILLRVSVVGCWGLALGGAPFVLRWIWRRNRGERTPYPVAKWWFAALLILLTAEPMAAYIKWNDNHLALPQLETVPEDGTFHIAALGGSTMRGWPYTPKFGIPPVYAWRLRQLYPAKKIVMHNLSAEGLDLKHALERLEKLAHHPHHLLLYSGHNEFYHDVEELNSSSQTLFFRLDHQLEFSPTFQLFNKLLSDRSEMRALQTGRDRQLIDRPIANPTIYRHRLARFRGHLDQLARYCQENGITAQWFVPACSDSVYEPDRSTVAPGTTEAEQDRLLQLYADSRGLQESENWEAAAERYRTGLEMQPEFAEFHFRLAECLFQLKRYDEAGKHFRLARDNDGYPVRANSDYCRQFVEVADEYGIPVIDSDAVLRQQTPFGILDRTMFHDNVHPTLKAFFLLATAAIEQLQDSEQFRSSLGTPADTGRVDLAAVIQGLNFSIEDLVAAYRHTADDLQWLGRLRFDDARRIREGKQYDRLAEQLANGEIQPGEKGTESLD